MNDLDFIVVNKVNLRQPHQRHLHLPAGPTRPVGATPSAAAPSTHTLDYTGHAHLGPVARTRLPPLRSLSVRCRPRPFRNYGAGPLGNAWQVIAGERQIPTGHRAVSIELAAA